jgi:hypothetical protein
MNHPKEEYDVKCKQYTISIDRPKKEAQGRNLCESQGGMPELCQMVLGTVRW